MQWETKRDWNWPSFETGYSNTVFWLSEHSSKVLVVGEIPELSGRFHLDTQLKIWKLYQNGGNAMPVLREPLTNKTDRHEALGIFKSCRPSNAEVLDPEPIFLNGNRSLRYYSDAGMFYYDDNHLNALGSMECLPLLEPYFRTLSRKSN